jgi:hypothetical protein
MEFDKSATMNRIQLNGTTRKFPEHGNALSLEEELGRKITEYQIFTFVRDPYDKIVSAYFFYKNGEPLVHKNLLWYARKGLKVCMKAFVSYLNILFARLVPFHIWSLIRSVKSNEKYLVDSNGEFLVNFIGQTENISSDLKSILEKLGFKGELGDVHRRNSSNHKSTLSYYNRKWHFKRINERYKRELRIYEFIKSKPADFNYRGLRMDDILKNLD